MQEIPRSQERIQRRPIAPPPREQSILLPDYAAPQKPAPRELTRDEYLDLLKTARRMRKALAYLAMRALVCTGIQLRELLTLTMEEVQTGEIRTAERTVHLPDSLREELLAYARRNGVSGGAIFVGKAGTITALSTVREQIKAVSRAAGMEDIEVSARTLAKLYEATRSELMAETVQRLMQEQLEREQAEHGWES